MAATVSVPDGYTLVSSAWCRHAEHRLDKNSLADCIAACRKIKCACVQFRASPRAENCRWMTDHLAHSKGSLTAPSKIGFNAYLPIGGSPSMTAQVTVPKVKLPPACTPGSGLDLRVPQLGTPKFYIYPNPIDERALMRCYAEHKHVPYPLTTDAALWMHRALLNHSSRVWSAAEASLLFVPSYAALSESASTCGSTHTSHFARMVAATSLLKSAEAFRLRPHAHLVINGVESAMRSPLGELGSTLASRGGHAACLDVKLCGAFKGDRVLALPWPPLAALQTAAVRASTDDEACARRRVERKIMLFFRGSLGSTADSQALRVRLLMLRQISGVVATLVGSEHWQTKASEYAAQMHLSTSRLRRMDAEQYAKLMLSSQFCACPVGDIATPGQRLYDAIAAGCVPIVIGTNADALPFARQVDYSKFAGFISRSAFLKDPVYAFEGMIHKLTPALPAMRRALADARHHLLYGTLPPNDDALTVDSEPSLGHVATLLLREAAWHVEYGARR